MEDGSIRVAEVTEDSLGTYACVPYNALGTMGQSPSAPLVLKVLTYVPMSIHAYSRTCSASTFFVYYLICTVDVICALVSLLNLHL